MANAYLYYYRKEKLEAAFPHLQSWRGGNSVFGAGDDL
jgi:hypothetical protein